MSSNLLKKKEAFLSPQRGKWGDALTSNVFLFLFFRQTNDRTRVHVQAWQPVDLLLDVFEQTLCITYVISYDAVINP